MTKVRVATLSDIPWLLSQLRLMAQDDEANGEARLIPGTDEAAIQVLTPFIEDHPFFIAERLRNEAERVELYQELVAGGLSDYEARGTAWPEKPEYEAGDLVPIGFIAGVLVPHYFNPNISVLAQTLWWVHPDHRGSSAGARLLDYFTAWGRIKGAQRINAAIGPKTLVSDRSMARKGFRLRDRTFTLEATP